ncbi:MAG TPA: pitrilysin family protein [Patescibacteria group bacterium]|nr:pitrilysin family protein [Patescibacteria group bacterium]
MATDIVAPISPLTPPLAPERPVVWPERTHALLSCGIPVRMVERHTIPKFSLQFLIRSGAATVALTEPGVAGLTAALLRTGTDSRDEHAIDEELRSLGADLGAGAGADASWISTSGLSEFSSELIALVADLARNPAFPAAPFERERRNSIEAVRLERSSPSFLATERFRSVLFGEHPYAVVAPTEAQVEAITRDLLTAFHLTHFSPSNALLLAVGDFSPPRLVEQLERAFHGWTGGAVEQADETPLPSHFGRHVFLVHTPGAVQTQILAGNLSITRQHPDWLRLTLTNAIFGGAFHSRLVANIREQKGYTYSPRSGVNALRRHGYFGIHAAVRNEVVAATLTEIFYELDRIRALPVRPDELSDAQAYLSGVFSLGIATLDGLAGQLASLYLYDLPEDYLETYRERIRAFTADDVLAAARSHFDSANMQIVVVGDADHVESQARLFGDVQVFDANGKLLSSD